MINVRGQVKLPIIQSATPNLKHIFFTCQRQQDATYRFPHSLRGP